MTAVRPTPRALRDLEDIADDTLEKWGADQAAAYLRDLDARFRWLADNPDPGRARDDVAKGYRCFPEGRHMIFYLKRPDHIAIIGVPHKAMDITGYFQAGERAIGPSPQ